MPPFSWTPRQRRMYSLLIILLGLAISIQYQTGFFEHIYNSFTEMTNNPANNPVFPDSNGSN